MLFCNLNFVSVLIRPGGETLSIEIHFGINPKREENGGGKNEKAPKTSLKTTMMKTHKPGVKKLGRVKSRGAKSRKRGEQLPRGCLTDSSQTGIKEFFYKLNGIIGIGGGPDNGRTPLGITRNLYIPQFSNF